MTHFFDDLRFALRQSTRGCWARPRAAHLSSEANESHAGSQTANDRFGAFLVDLFSGMALALAAPGIYGVLAFVVRGSRKEIAIRMAVGANPAEVVGLVVKRGMALTLAGVVLGLALALLATRALSALLFGVTATDPLTFAAISLLIALVALVASYLPARIAARVDPITALRSD